MTELYSLENASDDILFSTFADMGTSKFTIKLLQLQMRSCEIWEVLVLVVTCLGGRFEINCPSAFLKILKNHEGDLSQKSLEPNM